MKDLSLNNQKLWYHGSRKSGDIQEFKTAGKQVGDGIFFTASKKDALIHAGHSGWVYTVRLNIDKTWDFENELSLKEYAQYLGLNSERIKWWQGDPEAEMFQRASAGAWDFVEGDEFQMFLKKNNYDSYTTWENDVKNLAVYSGKQVEILKVEKSSDIKRYTEFRQADLEITPDILELEMKEFATEVADYIKGQMEGSIQEATLPKYNLPKTSKKNDLLFGQLGQKGAKNIPGEYAKAGKVSGNKGANIGIPGINRNASPEEYSQPDQVAKIQEIVDRLRSKTFTAEKQGKYFFSGSDKQLQGLEEYKNKLWSGLIKSKLFDIDNIMNHPYLGVATTKGRVSFWLYAYKNIMIAHHEIMKGNIPITLGDKEVTGSENVINQINEMRRWNGKKQVGAKIDDKSKIINYLDSTGKATIAENISYEMLVRDFGLPQDSRNKILFNEPFGTNNFPDWLIDTTNLPEETKSKIYSTFNSVPVKYVWIDTKASIGDSSSSGSTRLQYFPVSKVEPFLKSLLGRDTIIPKKPANEYEPIEISGYQYGEIIKFYMGSTKLDKEVDQSGNNPEAEKTKANSSQDVFKANGDVFLNKDEVKNADPYPLIVYREVGTDSGVSGTYKALRVNVNGKYQLYKVSDQKYNIVEFATSPTANTKKDKTIVADMHFYMGNVYDNHLDSTIKKQVASQIGDYKYIKDLNKERKASGEDLINLPDDDEDFTSTKSSAIIRYVSPDHWLYMFSFNPNGLSISDTPEYTPKKPEVKEKVVVYGKTDSPTFLNGHIIHEGTTFTFDLHKM